MKLVLEPRYLFDGSVHAVTKHATSLAEHDTSHHDAAVHPAAHSDAPASPAITVQTASQPNITALAPNPAADQILFIDTRVADWQTLAAGVAKDVQVVLIDPNKDGIQQVTDALQGRQNLESIQFLTYGQSGEIELGSSAVTTASLSSHAAEVASWGDHLAAGGDIAFYGCAVGEGSAGLAFVDTVHTLTGAEVGASTDATGDAALGGNWTLERTTGALAAGLPFSESSLDDYHHVLDINPVPTVTFTNVPTDILLGSTFTETVSFSNTAATAVGYGPFIDLFVPNDAAQKATLTSASYLGQAVTTDTVTLSTTVPGHTGVLGALHPFAVDSSGNPLFVAAPTGYQAGDTMYVLQLPFGSYTPGEPAAAINLTFSMNTKTELSSAHSSQPLNISAIGGFQFGLDPLNDPTTDPSIRGTTLTPSATSASDGLVVAASQVTLLDASAATNLHESETATGPDYPFDYVLTVTPAPATQSDPIQSLDFTFDLPSKVQYNNGTIAISGPGGSTGTATFHAGTGGPNTPGGTVTIHFTSLTTDGSDSPTTISIPVFVPQNDASGNPILNPSTGAPVTISTSPIYTYSGTWDATAASLDHNGGVATGFSGDSTGGVDNSSFVAKSLAIQVTDNAGGSILPGQLVTDTIHFQVSDYFSLNNLNIANLLSDGTTLLIPGDLGYAAPVLSVTRAGVTTGGISFGDAASSGSDVTVNGQSVSASGSAADWSYTRDDSVTGVTSVGFNVGGLLQSHFGGSLGSVLQGASGSTQGTITFVTKVLDKYTNANSGDSIRERDGVSDTVTTTGTSAAVVTVAGGVATPTGSSVTDGSSVGDAVTQGNLQLTVVAVNGSSADTTDIHPGDTVTYALTYNLTSGDYGNLNLTAFLPLPVFNAADPNANGGSVAAYSADNVDPFPTVGAYKLVNPGSGMTVISNATNSTANSINFNLGTRDDPTNASGQQAIIYFSVIASTAPYADALQLTAQGASSYTNASGATAAAAAIRPVLLNEPELKVKTGIVSLVADNGTTGKGTYSADPSGSGQTTSPAPSGASGSPFQPAGTATGSDPLTGSGLPFSSDDLNVTGADAGDMARVVSTVTNAGHATAYNVVVKGTLPAGYTTSDIHNFGIYNAAGVQIDTGVTAAQYFSAGGVTLPDAGGIAGQASIYVVYDLTLQATQATGVTLTPSSSIVNWTNIPTGGTNFVTSGTPVGESATLLSDSATIGTTAPTIGKTVTSGTDTSSFNATDPVNLSSVVLGETITYTLVITLPEGSTSNGGSQVTAMDILPTGTTLVGTPTITYDGNVTLTGGPSSGGGITPTVSGQTLTFNLGTALHNAHADTPDTITITYQVNITASNTPSNGHAYTNNASFQYSGTAVSPVSATVNEVDPVVAETISVTDGTTHNPVTNVFSGETLDYNVALHNTGTAPANVLTYYIEVPTTDLNTITPLTAPGGATITDTNTTVTKAGVTYEILEITDPTLAVGATDNFTFSAKVNDNLAAGTSILVGTPNDNSLTPGAATPSGTYNSLPTGIGTGHTYTGSASDTVSVATFTPSLKIIGEENNTSGGGTSLYTTAVSSVNATIGDIVRYSAYIQVPEGQNTSQSLTVNLPSGMTFQGSTNDTITVLLVSPGGVLSSTNVLASAQQSYSGTYDPTMALATTVLDSSHIHVSGSTITFDLGTLTDNESSPNADYVIIQFNAIVANTLTVGSGSTLSATATSGGQTSGNATVNVKEPNLTLTKTVSSIVNSGGTTTVTFSETVSNTGNTTAYNVSLSDPEGGNVGVVGNLTRTAGATTLSLGGNGTTDVTATGSLAAGASETFTYTEVVTDPTTGVSDATANVTFTSLSNTSESLSGTSTGASGSATGSRDGSSGTSGLNHYDAQVTLGLGVVSGRVWNDIGPDNTTFGESGSHDTGLSGVTVSGSFTGTGGTVTETDVTASDGTYFILAPDGTVNIALPSSGSGGLASNETLVYNDGHTVTPPAGVTGIAENSTTPAINVNFSYQTPDTAPVISGWGNSSVSATTPVVTYTEGGSPVILSTGASVTDTEIDETSHDYGASKLTIERYTSGGVAAPNASDVFVGTGAGASQLVLSGSTVTYGGSTVGTFTQSGGALTITFASGTTAATVNNVLNAVGYQGTDTNTIGIDVKIGAKLDDHNSSNLQGTGGNMTSAPVFVVLNETPEPGSVTYTEPNDSSASGAAIAVDGTVNVASGDSFGSVSVQITGGYQNGEDILTATVAGFTSSFNAATGTLTLTKAGATAAQIQTALRAVQYYDNSDTPNTTGRTLTVTVNDTTTGTAPTATISLGVTAANDSPILNTGVTVSLTSSTEDVTGAPTTGTSGTPVSSLVGTGINITDPDGAGVANGGTVAPAPGIAITAINTTYGNWYYSTDGGTTWTVMSGISATHALRLDANAEVYFQPTVANLNGTINNAITFRAWDQFGGGASGSFVDLTSVGTLGSGTNTAGSAYSSAQDSLPVTIAAVNDAPVASGTATSTGAQTVSALFGSNFNDSADGQPTLPGGSSANTLAGIAISGDTANPATEGVWQYSTNGGTSWTTITASSVSETGALVLSNTADLRFNPVVGFSGTPGGLTVHLIDNSTGNVSTTGVTGAALAGSTSVFTGIDIASHDGTPTPISTGTVPLTTTLSVPTPTVTFTEPNDTAASGAAVILDSTVALPSATYTSATIQVTGNGHSGEDVLVFTSSGSTGNITASGGSGGTPLTLSSAGNTATAAQWQAAIDGIKYYDSSDTPITSARTVTVSAVDTTGEKTTAAIVTVNVTAANDSPVLTPNAGLTLSNATQDSLGAPVGAVGTLVSSLVTGNVTDLDNAGLSNTGTVPAGQLGIAINQADTTEGNWYYSTDNGAHWTEFASGGMTAISNGNALHLLADGATRVYFQPTVAGANGVIQTALTYHGWDQFDGATNGTLSALPSGLGTGTNTAGSAYSSAVQVLPITISSVGGATFTDPNDSAASGAAVTVDAGLVFSGPDSYGSATVQITGGYQSGQDILTASPPAGFTSVFNATTGTLTLTKAGATAAEIQTALRSVQFYDTSNTPITTPRTITITVADTTTSSSVAVATETQSVTAANDSPILTPNASLTLANSTQDVLTPPSGAVGTLVSSLVTGNVTDTDNANLSNTGTVPAGALGIAIDQADTTEGNWWYSTDNGAHWTQFASSGMTAISDSNALHLLADGSTRVYFQPTVSGANGIIANALAYHAWDQFDGVGNGTLSSLPSGLGTGVNTTGSAYSSAIQVLPVTITAVGGASFTDPNDTAASGVAVVVDSTAVLTATADTFTSATVTITNFQPEDVLVFTSNASTGSITGNYSGGVMTLSAMGGATAAQFQAALQAVTYYDNSDTPITTTRNFTLSAHDSTSGMDVAVASGSIAVNAANDSPILNGLSVSLVSSTEDDGAPHGAVGTLVSALTGGGNVTDTDNANLSGTSTVPAGQLGIAITAADTTEGTWYYTTDGGTTWTAFASSGMTAISAANSLHLAADANTRIYFKPTANWNGEINNGLTFRGWDKYDGASNGSLSALPSGLGSGVNTAGSAYSSASQTLPIIGIAVNDAPIASGTATLTATTEDTSNPPGDTVAHLFGGDFNDSSDQQQTGGNPTGSVANTLAGIAITGNAATAGQGVYQYSTDNGAHWTTIAATGLSDSNAIILPSSAEIRFLPVANFNGVPGNLTTRLIDSSTVIVTGSTTGFDLSTGSTAFTGVDVSGANNGGTTAVSAATVSLTTSVTAVNDAPIASGTATLTSPNEDATNPASATVSSLLGQGTVSYTDATDTVTTAVSGGSTGTPPAAIAITGNTSTSAEGTYEYSTDGGTTWIDIPATGLSTTNAIVIPVSAAIRFVPAANFNGIPGDLTAHVSDGTALPAAGPQDISAAIGGTGGFSTGTVVISTSVVAVNDAPIATGTATLTATTEDTANPPGDTVGHLFGGNFSDTADQQQTGGNPTGSVANTLAGIAITGNAATATQGVYQYSTDGGTTWTTIPATGLSDGNSIVLPVSAELRFLPAANFNGVPGDLTTRLIDSSTSIVTGSTTGLALSTGSTAFSGVDVSGTNHGGTTAVSAAPVDLITSVVAVNDAPIASGTATLTTTTEDTANPPGDTVAHLFGGNFNDSTDQQQTGGNPTGSVANTLAGIAITGNAATAGQGVYQYSTDNGAHWTNIPTSGLSDSSAIILPSSADIRFVPVANFNGVPGNLTTRLIDSSTVVVTGSTTGFDLSTGSTAFTGVDVSGANNGGTTAVSAATVPLTTLVTAVNDAPVASGTATLTSPNEDATNPTGATVTSLLGQSTINYTDTTDTVTTAVSGGSTGTPAAAIAITGNTATPDQGVYQYSADGGTTWISIPATGLGTTNAIVIPVSAELRFVPTANFNGVPGQLTAHVSDGTALPATGPEDISAAIGGTGGFSTGTIVIGTSVVAVNDAPIASGTATLTPTNEDTANPPGDTVGHLFGSHFNDSTDQQQTSGNPTGSVANTLAGIAITGNAATPTQGVYQYSTDGGTTWITIPATGLSDGNSIVLPVSAELRFLPAANFNGIPGDLTTRLIDSSTSIVTGSTTGLALLTGSTAITGVDVSGANHGGTTAVSATPVDLTTSVVAVNDAPIATGSATLPPTTQNTLNPPGDTITDLFGGNFNDNTDLQKTATNPTGSVADTLAGIAITGNAATPAQGVYQYSTDNGAHWTSIPATGLGDGNAIILPASAELRFLPAIGFNGTPGALTTRLIDTSSGTLSGVETGVSLTAVGGITPYSADNVLLTTRVIEAVVVPIRTPTPPPSIFSFDTTNDNTSSVQKQFPDDLANSAGEGRAFTDDLLSRPIIPQVSLIGSVGNKFVIAEQQSIIAVPSNLFEDSYPGAQLEFQARSPDGGSLPSWLQFDARNLTFSGTPPATSHGAVDVLIVARDQFGHEATASFRILVGRDDNALQDLMAPPKKASREDETPTVVPPPSDANPGAAVRHRGQKSTARDTRHVDAGHVPPTGTVDGLFASLAGQPAGGHHLGRSAFTVQLRDAGAMGRLSQARHLLDARAKVDPVKPAA